MLSIQEFFRNCEARARANDANGLPLKAHLALETGLIDDVEEKSMRNRTIAALKTPKYRGLSGTVILNDGSRSEVFSGQTVVESNVPAAIRPASITLAPLAEIREQDGFALPSTSENLGKIESALVGLSRSKQSDAISGIRSLNDERVMAQSAAEASRIRAEDQKQRADDLAAALEDARRNTMFLQEHVRSITPNRGSGGLVKA